MREPDEQLRDLYVTSYSRLVALVAALSGSREDAEEAVQGAFVRLVPRWESVRGYEDPEAWVRKVAFGLAANRRRKLRNGLNAARRLGPVQDVPAPSGDAVDVARALAVLPRGQREVLVLVHIVGMSVEAAAGELGVPVGTVKSRLSRGRAALLPLLVERNAHELT